MSDKSKAEVKGCPIRCDAWDLLLISVDNLAGTLDVFHHGEHAMHIEDPKTFHKDGPFVIDPQRGIKMFEPTYKYGDIRVSLRHICMANRTLSIDNVQHRHQELGAWQCLSDTCATNSVFNGPDAYACYVCEEAHPLSAPAPRDNPHPFTNVYVIVGDTFKEEVLDHCTRDLCEPVFVLMYNKRTHKSDWMQDPVLGEWARLATFLQGTVGLRIAAMELNDNTINFQDLYNSQELSEQKIEWLTPKQLPAFALFYKGEGELPKDGGQDDTEANGVTTRKDVMRRRIRTAATSAAAGSGADRIHTILWAQREKELRRRAGGLVRMDDLAREKERFMNGFRHKSSNPNERRKVAEPWACEHYVPPSVPSVPAFLSFLSEKMRVASSIKFDVEAQIRRHFAQYMRNLRIPERMATLRAALKRLWTEGTTGPNGKLIANPLRFLSMWLGDSANFHSAQSSGDAHPSSKDKRKRSRKSLPLSAAFAAGTSSSDSDEDRSDNDDNAEDGENEALVNWQAREDELIQNQATASELSEFRARRAAAEARLEERRRQDEQDEKTEPEELIKAELLTDKWLSDQHAEHAVEWIEDHRINDALEGMLNEIFKHRPQQPAELMRKWLLQQPLFSSERVTTTRNELLRQVGALEERLEPIAAHEAELKRQLARFGAADAADASEPLQDGDSHRSKLHEQAAKVSAQATECRKQLQQYTSKLKHLAAEGYTSSDTMMSHSELLRCWPIVRRLVVSHASGTRAAEEAMSTLNALLKRGLSVNHAPYGYTILYLACAQGDQRLCEALISHGADIHRWSRDGTMPIDVASAMGHKEVVECLLQRGSHFGGALHHAAAAGHVGVARVLVDHGVHVDSLVMPPNETTPHTPLALAVMHHNTQMIRFFLNLGTVDPGRLPSHLKTAKILIAELNTQSAGSVGQQNVGAANFFRVQRFLDEKVPRGSTDIDDIRLQRILKFEHELTESLRISDVVDAKDSMEWTSLMYAAVDNDAARARVLIALGANVMTTNRFNLSAALWAKWHQSEAVLRLIVEKNSRMLESDKEAFNNLNNLLRTYREDKATRSLLRFREDERCAWISSGDPLHVEQPLQQKENSDPDALMTTALPAGSRFSFNASDQPEDTLEDYLLKLDASNECRGKYPAQGRFKGNLPSFIHSCKLVVQDIVASNRAPHGATPVDIFALHLYTRAELFGEVNRAYRDGNEAEMKRWWPVAWYITRAQRRLRASGGVFFRGVGRLFHFVQWEKYQPGSIITWGGFSSSTKDPRVATDFLHSGQDLTKVEGVIFKIYAKSPLSIEWCSFVPSEREYLFQHSTSFRVLNWYEGTDVNIRHGVPRAENEKTSFIIDGDAIVQPVPLPQCLVDEDVKLQLKRNKILLIELTEVDA